MIILGIDPGAKGSGFVYWEMDRQIIIGKGICENSQLKAQILEHQYDILAIENIRGYGIVAGDETFDTCIWIGRFDADQKAMLLSRKEIKRHLCGNTTTTDKYIRQALIDRLGIQGNKKSPGPLFGISGHCWAALSVCIVAADRLEQKGIK